MPSDARPAKPRARPRSASVREELTDRIDRGLLSAGSRLPSEPALATELGVSRATLRDALRSLEGEGLVRRMWGSGTYVAQVRRVANSLDMNFGVTDAIRAAGMKAGTEQARYWFEPASAGEAGQLNLQPGQDVLVVERVRTADGKPVVLSRDILPGWCERRAGGPDAETSMYEVLERDSDRHPYGRHFRPVQADVTWREGWASRGELAGDLAVDYANDVTRFIHEYHLADAFDFTVHRRGPKEVAVSSRVGKSMRLKRVIDPGGIRDLLRWTTG
jgi:GntR family transcriptional regulator